jgi:hypothetical protein
MDLDGKQLTSDGWKEMATFFVQLGQMRWETIDVMS